MTTFPEHLKTKESSTCFFGPPPYRRAEANGRYDQACILPQEIKCLGIPIPLSLEYETPVITDLKKR